MPRAKIAPKDRQRTYRACLICKASKIRCDSESPCSSCVKRGRESSCVYPDVHRRQMPRDFSGPTQEQQARLRNHQSQPQEPQNQGQYQPLKYHQLPQQTTLRGDISLSSPPTQVSGGTHVDIIPNTLTTNVNQVLTPLDLTINPAKPKSYSTETTSHSFLHFLRNSLRPYVGVLRFTDSKRDDMLPEVDIQDVNTDNLHCSIEQMYRLLDLYFEATSGLLDLFTADEVDTLIEQRSRRRENMQTPVPNAEDLAALDAALAIGAQILPLGNTDRQLEEALFSRARKIAFGGMLAKPTLSMVRLFLLLAFYMLGTNHRSAAAMYLGIATKAAVVLGLDNPRNCAPGNLTVKSRTWTSLRILDVLASFIFGKPQNLSPPVQDPLQVDNTYDTIAWSGKTTFPAMYEGCNLIENIVQALRKGSMLDVPNAEEWLSQLRTWTHTLPEEVRQFTFGEVSNLETEDRQGLISSVHISCLYYFAVILITRPFLIAYLMSRLRGRAPDHLVNDPEEASDVRLKNNTVAKLAHVCFSAATYMAETLQKIKASNFTFGNLFLIKAWIFGSGLVLGFSRFAGEPRQDIEAAFEGCRDVLKMIGESCHQARPYHEILTSFGEAIVKHRQQISSASRRTVQHYMDQVLVVKTAGTDESQNRPDRVDARFGLPVSSLSESGIQFTGFGDRDLDMFFVDFQIDWAELDMQFLD